MDRLALLSVHGCPVARLGAKDTGGMNVYVLQVAKELGKRGHKIDVFTRIHDPNDEQIMELGQNARVIHLNAGPYGEAKAGLRRYIPQFLDSLSRFQNDEGLTYDLVHSHYWLSGLAGVELSRTWSVPHATTFHTLARAKMEVRPGDLESEVRLDAESAVMSSVDSMVVSTEQEREDLRRLYQVTPQRVRVVPAGVDLDLFVPMDRQEARRSLGLKESKIILSVGRMEPLKGLDILISAFAGLKDISDARLLIVGGDLGSDQEIKRLRSLAAKLGLSDRITFTGVVQQTELPKYYSAANVFVMPSYYESFGLATLEAMACGAAVVTSRVGGPMSFVEEGRTGFLVPWACPEPYSERIDMLLSDPDLQTRIGLAGAAKARDMGWNTVASALSDHYDALIGETWMDVAGA